MKTVDFNDFRLKNFSEIKNKKNQTTTTEFKRLISKMKNHYEEFNTNGSAMLNDI